MSIGLSCSGSMNSRMDCWVSHGATRSSYVTKSSYNFCCAAFSSR